MQKNIPYIVIAFGVAALTVLLSFLDLYDNFEHYLLDMRFKSRGMMETRGDIATADIDVRALQTEGKWDPWSREKHIPMVNLAAEHGLDAFIFDVYFIEDSERKLEYKVLNSVSDSVLSMENVKELFPDPDNDLAKADIFRELMAKWCKDVSASGKAGRDERVQVWISALSMSRDRKVRCGKCGDVIQAFEEMDTGHRKKRIDGGPKILENLQPEHGKVLGMISCNRSDNQKSDF